MSLDRQQAIGMNPLDQVSAETGPPTKQRHPILSACYSLVALATGLTLAIIPWVDTWNFNYLQGINPTLEFVWDEPSFRASVTALGLLNVLIGLRELVTLFRGRYRSTH